MSSRTSPHIVPRKYRHEQDADERARNQSLCESLSNSHGDGIKSRIVSSLEDATVVTGKKSTQHKTNTYTRRRTNARAPRYKQNCALDIHERPRPYGSAMDGSGCLIPIVNVGCRVAVCAAGPAYPPTAPKN